MTDDDLQPERPEMLASPFSIFVIMFIGCDHSVHRSNIVFAYPSGFVSRLRSADEIADNLQSAFDFLADEFPAPPGQNYRRFFSENRRIKVGYRRGRQDRGDGHGPVDEEESNVCAGYWPPEQRINVPWALLAEMDRSHSFAVPVALQPEHCCGHELIHPFEAIMLKGNRNQEAWKEGLCDFLRVILLNHWAASDRRFGDTARQYEAFIASQGVHPSPQRNYHLAAHLIWRAWTSNSLGLKPFLNDLFANDMTAELGNWAAQEPKRHPRANNVDA